jgi:arginase family enzyme
MLTQEQKDKWLEIMMNISQPTEGGKENRIHSDVPSFMNCVIAYTPEHLKGLDAAFLGIPWEGMVGIGLGMWATCGPQDGNFKDDFELRAGTYLTPDYIRRWSVQYAALLDPNVSFFPEVSDDFNMGSLINVADYGNVDIKEYDPAESLNRAYLKASDIVKGGAIPLIFGGDHSIPHSVVKAISDNTTDKMGVIWYDRHYDNIYGGDLPYPHTEMSRPNPGNALYKMLDECNIDPSNVVMIGPGGGDTNFREMVDIMKMLEIKVFTSRDVEEQGLKAITKQAIKIAGQGTDSTYVTLDADSMDPFSFPAMRWSEPYGLHAREVKDSVAMITESLNLAGFDICCMSPAYDTHGIGGQVAARFYIEILKQLALKKQRNKE